MLNSAGYDTIQKICSELFVNTSMKRYIDQNRELRQPVVLESTAMHRTLWSFTWIQHSWDSVFVVRDPRNPRNNDFGTIFDTLNTVSKGSHRNWTMHRVRVSVTEIDISSAVFHE